jgi:hypothetical protein
MDDIIDILKGESGLFARLNRNETCRYDSFGSVEFSSNIHSDFYKWMKSNPKLEPVIEPGDNTVVENITGDSGNNGNSVDSGNGGNIGDNGNSSNSGGVGNNSSSDDNRSTPKGNAVWLKYHGRFIPVSHMVDGKQQLLNDESEWYFDVEERTGLIYDLNKAGNTDKAGIMDKAVIHDTRKMYAGSEQNPHDDPLARGAWLDFLSGELGDEIAISGNWEPFVVKVRYECYSLHTQPNNQAWKDYFDARIKEVSATTPLIIKNAWFFDIDSDGREESVVNANNTVYEEELEMSPPVLENTAVYTFTAYFGGDGTVIELDGYAATDEVALEPISDQSDVTVSYMVDENYQDILNSMSRHTNMISMEVSCYARFSTALSTTVGRKNILFSQILTVMAKQSF